MINWDDFHWSSDWNGDEVGYDDVDVVGLYTMKAYPINVYIDVMNGKILDAWCNECDEES